MVKKCVYMDRTDIYAVYFRKENIIYYNMSFKETTMIIVFK